MQFDPNKRWNVSNLNTSTYTIEWIWRLIADIVAYVIYHMCILRLHARLQSDAIWRNSFDPPCCTICLRYLEGLGGCNQYVSEYVACFTPSHCGKNGRFAHAALARIVLSRHGQSEGNVDHLLYTSPSASTVGTVLIGIQWEDHPENADIRWYNYGINQEILNIALSSNMAGKFPRNGVLQQHPELITRNLIRKWQTRLDYDPVDQMWRWKECVRIMTNNNRPCDPKEMVLLRTELRDVIRNQERKLDWWFDLYSYASTCLDLFQKRRAKDPSRPFSSLARQAVFFICVAMTIIWP